MTATPDATAVAQPLFVAGTARSGTSYFHDLLNQHPDVRLSYEGRLATEGWECYKRRKDDISNTQGFDRLLDDFITCDQNESQNQWLAEAIKAHREQLFAEHQQSGNFPNLIESIYQLPGRVGCWGNKMLRIEMVPAVAQHWPNAKFIVLVRDPRAVSASQLKFFPNRRLHYALIYWNVHARWVNQVRQDSKRFLVVKYEDFIASSHEQLQKVLEFAGVWEEKVCNDMLEAHPARTKPLGKWRKDLSLQQLKLVEEICFEQMKELGYEPQVAERQVKIGQGRKMWEIFQEKRHLVFDMKTWQQKQPLRRVREMLR